jgi:DNA polymerase-3 subunit alpha (Gram-positive type)
MPGDEGSTGEDLVGAPGDGPDLWAHSGQEDLINVIDTETTGLERDARIVEIAVARVHLPDCEVLARASQLVDPQMPIPERTTRVHGITDQMVRGRPTIDVVLPKFFAFAGKSPVLAHNAAFDRRIIQREAQRIGLKTPDLVFYDSIELAKNVLPPRTVRNHKLPTLIDHFGTRDPCTHRALADTIALVGVLRALLAHASGRPFSMICGRSSKL